MSGEEENMYELAQIAQKKAIRRRRKRVPGKNAGIAAHATITLSPTQRAGQHAEEQAKRHLEAAGLIVLGQNLRSRTGEIDLVCLDQATLAFIEVRQRQSNRYGGAAASVNLRKQQRLIRTAHYFLPHLTRRFFNGATPACRFDVVTIEPDGLLWFKHAFPA